ncbi:MAG: glycine-rich protein, partial [Planctomycetota bacterium]|nr:glycine-rich protein [Planctomycetota bacterium]
VSNTQYYYRVYAYNAGGESTRSNELPVKTLAAPAPNPPLSATAIAFSTNTIRVQWADNSSDETGFKVERSTDGTLYALRSTLSANMTLFDDTPITPNTTFYYRIRSYNNDGDSAPSNIASATIILKADALIALIAGVPPPALDDYVWVANGGSNNVTRIKKADLSTSTIAVGTYPVGVAVDETYCWVANQGSNNVTRILKSNPAISTTIAVGDEPRGVAVDETYCWVANRGPNNVTRILKSNPAITTTIAVGLYPIGVAVDETYCWVTNQGSHNVTRILKSDLTTTNISEGIGITPTSYGVAVDETYCWVANDISNNVTRIKKSDLTTTTISTGSSPSGVAVDETYCWVVNTNSKNVTRIKKADLSTSTIAVGSGPRGVAVDGTYCWVVNEGSNVTRILKSDLTTTTIGVGSYPYSLGDMTGYTYDNYAKSVAYLGDNIYNLDATSQTAQRSTLNSQLVSYHIRVQNDGNVSDIFSVSGSGSSVSGWTVSYYDAETGGTEITAQVTGSGYLINLSPNNLSTIRLEVTPVSAAAGSFLETLVTASSSNAPSKKDTVKARTTMAFDYTGSQQTWVVPAGVTSITVDVLGAKGGNGSSGGVGGNGARVQTTLSVTPGQTLYIYVGGQSSNASGGYNGGGTGGNLGGSSYAGGGGGASDIRQGGTILANRVVVAGGGGGGGGAQSGGPSGGSGGQNGGDGSTYAGGGGGGGTQSA